MVLFNLAAVSAADADLADYNYLTVDNQDINSTVSVSDNLNEVKSIQTDDINKTLSADEKQVSADNNVLGDSINSNEKLNLTLTPVNTGVFIGQDLEIIVKDQNGKSYAGMPIFLRMEGKNFKAVTDESGHVSFPINNVGGSYSVELIYLGNAHFNAYSKSVNIYLQKLNLTLTPVTTTLSGGQNLRVLLKDQYGKSYSSMPVFLRVDGKTFKSVTDSSGYASFSINKASGKFSVELIYLGNARYNAYSKVVSVNLQKLNLTLTPATTTLGAGQNFRVLFKDQEGKSYAALPIFIKFDGKTFKSVTDSSGYASFSINKASGKFSVELIYLGNARYNAYSKVVSVNLQKLDLNITPINTTVLKGNSLKALFKDQNGKSYANMPVFMKLSGKYFKSLTDSKGYVSFNLDKDSGKYNIELIYLGNNYFNAYSEAFSIIIPKTTTIEIGNDKLLTGGFLRIYLKSDEFWPVAQKTLTINVGTQKFIKKTNSEGIVIFKPGMSKNTYNVTVEFKGTPAVAGSSAYKKVQCINGNVINPLLADIPAKNGMPDVDYMPGTFALADGNMQYTVVKSEYLDVIKRDSYCLFLHNKLTKYTLFKTKLEPNLYHLIHRTKWNVIEREINTQIVTKNQYNYWPSEVTVSLKGKSYTYPEVRDVQNTGYTCGPTSCSMCTQVLRNYVNEAHLSTQAGSNAYDGSSTAGLKKALESFNMKCDYYYKSSFDTAINELKKGGCALIFHTWNHYVAILDISSDGKKVLVGNPSGDYDHGSHSIPTNWLTVDYMKDMFNDYDTSGLIVKLNYSLTQSTKNQINQFYKNMGSWNRQNTNERIPQI